MATRYVLAASRFNMLRDPLFSRIGNLVSYAGTDFEGEVESIISSIFERITELRSSVAFWLLNVLHVCDKYNLSSRTVASIFTRLCEVDEKLAKILLAYCFSGQRNFLNTSERIMVAHRVLHSAQELKLTFNGNYMVGMFPLEQCRWLQRLPPENFLLLIQHGVGLCASSSVMLTTLRILLFNISFECHLMASWTPIPWINISSEERGPQNLKKLAKWFQLLVEEMDQPQYVTRMELMSPKNNMPSYLPNEIVLLPLYDSLFPGMRYGRNEIPSLKHVSKIAIRKALQANHQLPYGIDALPLPPVLKDYVKLERFAVGSYMFPYNP